MPRRTASSGVGASGTRAGSNPPGGTWNAAGNSAGTRPGSPRTVSVITQSVWPHATSRPDSSRPSVRRRAHTLRKPVTAVDRAIVVPSGIGASTASSIARTTQARFREAYQSRPKPSRSEWIHARSWA